MSEQTFVVCAEEASVRETMSRARGRVGVGRIGSRWSGAALAVLALGVALPAPGLAGRGACGAQACAEEIAALCGPVRCSKRKRCARRLMQRCRAGKTSCASPCAGGVAGSVPAALEVSDATPRPAHVTQPLLQPTVGTCTKTPRRNKKASTLGRLQHTLFDRSCAAGGCHDAATGAGGLVLTPEQAYEQLVWARASARPHQFRVAPGDPTDSYLVEVLGGGRAGPAAPAAATHAAFMTSKGKDLDRLRAWILAGAPRTGIVPADRGGAAALDTSPSIPPPPAPPPGEGIQLHFGPYEVPPHSEWEVCRYEEMPPVPASVCAESRTRCETAADCQAGEDCVFFMRGAEAFIPVGAHHFFLVTYDGTDGREVFPKEVRNDPFCLGFGPPGAIFEGGDIVRGQTAAEAIGYGPPGVAKRLRAGQPMLLDAHFVNRRNVPLTVDIWVNVDFARPEEVTATYDGGRLQVDDDINVPACATRTNCLTWTPESPTNMFLFFTHNDTAVKSTIDFCERVEGDQCVQVGARLYENQHALDPELFRPAEPLRLEAGQGLQHCCTHVNDPPRMGCTGTQNAGELPGITTPCHTDADCEGLRGATGRCEPQALRFGLRDGSDACLLIGYHYD